MHRKTESYAQKWYGNKEHKDANCDYDEDVAIRTYERNEKKKDNFLIIDRSFTTAITLLLLLVSKSTKANTCHKVLLMAKSSHFADVPSLVRSC